MLLYAHPHVVCYNCIKFHQYQLGHLGVALIGEIWTDRQVILISLLCQKNKIWLQGVLKKILFFSLINTGIKQSFSDADLLNVIIHTLLGTQDFGVRRSANLNTHPQFCGEHNKLFATLNKCHYVLVSCKYFYCFGIHKPSRWL